MGFILKYVLLERCKTPSSLKSLDLSKEESLFLPKDTELVLDEKDRISKLKTKDMSETEINAFEKECCTVRINVVNKLFDQNLILSKYMVQGKNHS